MDTRDLLQQAFGTEVDLPALPTNISRLLDQLNDPEVNMERLSQGISLDQAVSAKILRLVNSSFYGMAGRIANLRQAVMVLGLDTVKQAILSMAVAGASQGLDWEGTGLSLPTFWRHTVTTGMISQVIARATGHPDLQDAFVAGLLHDIGKLLILHASPEAFKAALKTASTENLFSWEAEKSCFEINHATLGGALAADWRFPPHIAESISLHHAPQNHAHPLTGLVHLADSLAIALCPESIGCGLVPPIDPEIWQTYFPSSKGLRRLLPQITEALESVPSILDIYLG